MSMSNRPTTGHAIPPAYGKHLRNNINAIEEFGQILRQRDLGHFQLAGLNWQPINMQQQVATGELIQDKEGRRKQLQEALLSVFRAQSSSIQPTLESYSDYGTIVNSCKTKKTGQALPIQSGSVATASFNMSSVQSSLAIKNKPEAQKQDDNYISPDIIDLSQKKLPRHSESDNFTISSTDPLQTPCWSAGQQLASDNEMTDETECHNKHIMHTKYNTLDTVIEKKQLFSFTHQTSEKSQQTSAQATDLAKSGRLEDPAYPLPRIWPTHDYTKRLQQFYSQSNSASKINVGVKPCNVIELTNVRRYPLSTPIKFSSASFSSIGGQLQLLGNASQLPYAQQQTAGQPKQLLVTASGCQYTTALAEPNQADLPVYSTSRMWPTSYSGPHEGQLCPQQATKQKTSHETNPHKVYDLAIGDVYNSNAIQRRNNLNSKTNNITTNPSLFINPCLRVTDFPLENEAVGHILTPIPGSSRRKFLIENVFTTLFEKANPNTAEASKRFISSTHESDLTIGGIYALGLWRSGTSQVNMALVTPTKIANFDKTAYVMCCPLCLVGWRPKHCTKPIFDLKSCLGQMVIHRRHVHKAIFETFSNKTHVPTDVIIAEMLRVLEESSKAVEAVVKRKHH